MQTLRVVVESYRSGYDVGLNAFRLFRIFFAVYAKCIHFRFKTYEFGHYRTVIFILHQPWNLLIYTRHIICIVGGIIASVVSIDIVFHGLVDIVALKVINEVVSVGV